MTRKIIRSSWRIIRGETPFVFLKASLAKSFLSIANSKLLISLKRRYIIWLLEQFKLKSEQTVVIIYSYVGYFHPMRQRPQHIAHSLSQHNQLTIYITPQKGRSDFVNGIKKINNHLFLSDDIFPFLEFFNNVYTLIYAIDNSITYNLYSLLKQKSQIVYDYMDLLDQDVFKGKSGFLELHQHILSTPDNIVLVSSEELKKDSLRYRQKVYFLPNACTPNYFKAKRDLSKINKKMQNIVKRKKTIIGFFGALACWLDYDLLIKVAKSRQDLSFVFIGPDIDSSSYKLKQSNLDNVFLMGIVPFHQLKHYAIWFDVSIIPFSLRDLTHAVSPVKLFEYMAIGKPIVATNTKELKKYKSVLLADSADEFVKQIDNALKKQNDKNYKKIMQKELSKNTWDHRAKEIIEAIKDNEESKNISNNRH